MPPRKGSRKGRGQEEAQTGQASSSQGPMPPPGMARESENWEREQREVAEQAGQPVGTGAQVAAEAPAREARQRARQGGDEEKDGK